jgi:hypothetical protein
MKVSKLNAWFHLLMTSFTGPHMSWHALPFTGQLAPELEQLKGQHTIRPQPAEFGCDPINSPRRGRLFDRSLSFGEVLEERDNEGTAGRNRGETTGRVGKRPSPTVAIAQKLRLCCPLLEPNWATTNTTTKPKDYFMYVQKQARSRRHKRNYEGLRRGMTSSITLPRFNNKQRHGICNSR